MAGSRRARSVERDELTAQGLRAALAVARGGTNCEVATELFLSLGRSSSTCAEDGLEEAAPPVADPAARV